jgi:hypothetical protein
VPGGCPAPEVELGISLVVIVIVAVVVIVVVFVPIMIRAPAMSIFIPQAMVVIPTPGARFRQLVAIFRGLGTIPAVMLRNFVEFMVCVDDALLAVVIGAHWRGTHKEQCCAQGSCG